MNCYLMGVICESDNFSKHVSHSLAASVCILHAKALSELRLCPRLAPILSQKHNSAAAAQARDAGNDAFGWEMQHMFWQGLHFLLSAAVHVQRPWLSAQRFSFFLCGTGQWMNTKHLLWSCRDNSILYYPGFSQRQADISLRQVVNVCRLALGAEWEGDRSQTILQCFLILRIDIVIVKNVVLVIISLY